ncbi:YgeY family selenium metabolism-linked hydrolase [Sporolactobacillus sp. THM7-4]|nr:YgeY family selenium metabolism-linked hydrolase [Sporolactobacillus sp. THM7-4]
MLDEREKEEVISLCEKLVNSQSYSGKEDKAAKILKEYAKKKLFFDEIFEDSFGNVGLVIKGALPGPTVLLDGHIDTVPVNTDHWATDPFHAVIKDGKIYGRGTSDMKGSVSAMIVAAEKFAEKTGKQFPGKIVISCSVHEETFEGVATRKVSEKFHPDVVVIGEATNLNINRGQRGRAEIVVETIGKSVHSANPEKGINAVSKMMILLTEIEKLPTTQQPFMGEGILVPTDIISSPYPGKSVLPASCRVTFDRRTLVGETKASVLSPIQQVIDELKQSDPEFDAKVFYSRGKDVCYTEEIIEAERFFPAWLYDENEPFVKKPLQALRAIGIPAELSHYSFCTNGSHFAGEAGIPTIGFGPSRENLAHTDNEYVEIEQLTKAVEGFAAIIRSLLEDK